VITGLFGTVLWLAIVIVAGDSAVAIGGMVLAALAAAYLLLNTEMIEVSADMANVGLVVFDRQERDGKLPDSLVDLGLSQSTLTDPWGQPYQYRIVEDDDFGFDLASGGRDGVIGTDDDIALSRIDAAWEDAFDGFDKKMEELGERFERLNRSSRHGGPVWVKKSRGYEEQAEREIARRREAEATQAAPEPAPAPQPPVEQAPVAAAPPPAPVAPAPVAAPPPVEEAPPPAESAANDP
jgi:hypothetical protein